MMDPYEAKGGSEGGSRGCLPETYLSVKDFPKIENPNVFEIYSFWKSQSLQIKILSDFYVLNLF